MIDHDKLVLYCMPTMSFINAIFVKLVEKSCEILRVQHPAKDLVPFKNTSVEANKKKKFFELLRNEFHKNTSLILGLWLVDQHLLLTAWLKIVISFVLPMVPILACFSSKMAGLVII